MMVCYNRSGSSPDRRSRHVSSIRDWEERKYREVFEHVCSQLEARRLTDPAFTIQQAEGTLQTAYIDQGNDFIGRGAVVETVQSATIAAYEHVLAQWRDEEAAQTRER